MIDNYCIIITKSYKIDIHPSNWCNKKNERIEEKKKLEIKRIIKPKITELKFKRMSEIVTSKSEGKKKKALFFFSKSRIFLSRKKKEKRAARFDSNKHESKDFPEIFSNLFRRKIKIGDYIRFRKRGENKFRDGKNHRNARSIERQLERTVKEPPSSVIKIARLLGSTLPG